MVEAPIDATRIGQINAADNMLLTYPTNKMAANTASTERNFSLVLNGAGSAQYKQQF